MIKRIFFISAVIISFGFCADIAAQSIILTPKSQLLQGGEKGKSYQIMLTSTIGKKGIVNDFIAFLDEIGICDKQKLQKRIDEIDDKTTDFTVDFSLPVPMFLTRLYGVSSSVPAVELEGDLYFTFHNDTVIIDFKNWKSQFFQIYNTKDSNFDLTQIYNPAPAEKKGFFQQLAEENLGEKTEKVKTPEQLALDEWRNYSNEKMMQNTVLYKTLSVATGILFSVDPTVDKKKMYGEIKNILKADYVENREKEFPIYFKLMDLDLGDFFSDAKYTQFWGNMPTSAFYTEKTKQAQLGMYNSFLEKNEMFAVSTSRWEKQIRPLLSLFFKALVFGTDSKVLGVAEDGFTTYMSIDGMVLPVDPQWQRGVNGLPILPSDPIILDKYKKKNAKKQY
jgi:hypothetical protein